jgi:hypothetical protein
MTILESDSCTFVTPVPVVREICDDGVAAAAGVTVSGAITIEIAGAVVHAERGIDLGWLRDVLRAVKAAT